jgi:hypothetical protein
MLSIRFIETVLPGWCSMSNLIFKVSRTYSEVTPESAKDGEFSETGFVFQDDTYTLRELIAYIKSEGFYREVGTNWLTTGFYTECHQTCTEREESLHIELLKGAN